MLKNKRNAAVAAMFVACNTVSALAPLRGASPWRPPPPGAVPGGGEGRKTVKISQHVYVIPDEHVPQVPNVGIIIGSKATLVGSGMGLKSGEAVAREVAKVSSTRSSTSSTRTSIPSTRGRRGVPESQDHPAAAQQQDVEEMGMKWVASFSQRSKEMRKCSRVRPSASPTRLSRRKRRSISAAFACASSGSDPRTLEAIPRYSSKATTSCSPAISR